MEIKNLRDYEHRARLETSRSVAVETTSQGEDAEAGPEALVTIGCRALVPLGRLPQDRPGPAPVEGA